jgi:putative transposase
MPRKPRIIIPGYPHHIVQRGHNKQTVFRNNDDRKTYLMFLAEYSARHSCKLLAYCLMKNHVHLLLIPSDRESFIKFNHGLGFRYGMYFNFQTKNSGAVWENRYFSSVVCEDEYLFKVFQYIILNPVRAGITADPCDYVWSSARSILLGRENGVPTESFLDSSQILQLAETCIDYTDEASIKYCTHRGLPYASLAGYLQLSNAFGKDLTPKPRGAPEREFELGTGLLRGPSL